MSEYGEIGGNIALQSAAKSEQQTSNGRRAPISAQGIHL